MANTYTLISSNVLSASAASVTFSAIPSTYTDLVIRCSARGDSTATVFRLYFNGDSGTTSYSLTSIRGDGTTATSGAAVSASTALVGALDLSTYTANTFSSTEIYIPSYTVSQNKQFSSFTVNENNATTALIYGLANLFSDTTAISSITIINQSANFVSGSSFYLYGIKNS